MFCELSVKWSTFNQKTLLSEICMHQTKYIIIFKLLITWTKCYINVYMCPLTICLEKLNRDVTDVIHDRNTIESLMN